MKNPLKWFRRTEKKSGKVLGTTPELGKFLMYGSRGYMTASQAMGLYNGTSAVSIPINWVAEHFASLRPVIKTGEEIETDHEVLELLKNPSPFFSCELFQETMGKYFLITGETLCVALGNTNRPPLELQPINPENRSVNKLNGIAGSFIVSGDVLTGDYKLERDDNRVRYFDGPLRELKQIRMFSTRNSSMLEGQSPLLSASTEARQYMEGTTHNLALLKHGGTMSLLFHFEEDMEDDDYEAVKEKIEERWSGATKAGKVGVTSGGKLTVEDLGTNNKDMDFANLQELAKLAVALEYKVPLPLIFARALTFNNYREAKLALYDDAVLPLADRVYGGLSEWLLPRYGMDPTESRITYDPASITALATRRNEELKLRKELGVETDNELRAMLGREEIEGGDVLYKPANMVPAGIDIFTEDNRTTPRRVRDE